MMTFRSTRIILLVVACILALSGVFIATQLRNNTDTYTVASNTLSVQNIAPSIRNTASTDSDNDGLMDWEEVLWKTDPKNADTDSDGILDGEDVRKNTLIPNEITKTPSVTTAPAQTGEVAGVSQTTLTDKIAQEAFTQYTLFKQTGQPLTAQKAQEIALNIVEKQSFKEGVPRFSALHLTNIVPDSVSTLDAYGNDIWNAMMQNTPKNVKLENEYVILLTALQKDDEEYLKKMDPIIDGYKNTIQALLRIPVPQSLADEHVDFVNSMNVLLALIEDMREYYTDTIKGLGAITYYGGQTLELRAALTRIITALKEKNVDYVEGESGYLLMHSI